MNSLSTLDCLTEVYLPLPIKGVSHAARTAAGFSEKTWTTNCLFLFFLFLQALNSLSEGGTVRGGGGGGGRRSVLKNCH